MNVEFADPEPNGLAWMVGELIAANLDRHPRRRRLLKPAVVDLTAPDADVSASIRLSPERVIVSNGLQENGRPHLHVQADSGTLLLLSSVPLRLGFPDPSTAEGRRIYGKLLSRQIRISRVLMHPGKLRRLSKLLSVV